jgi:hypothetical protein
MTKPTGRPRGRPKTREYTTLMARVDVALADQVKRYASLHRQPLSVVIRDALSLLMEEYPSRTAMAGPQRLAAHEFLSDRYESPLDTLVGETDSASFDELLSDRNQAAISIIDADATSDRAYVSDIKEDDGIVSDTKGVPTPLLSDAQRGTDKASDRNADEGFERVAADINAALAPLFSPSPRKGRATQAGPTPIMPDTKVDDPGTDKAAIVARLHQMRDQGMSLQAIADQLQAEGLPTLSGTGQWRKGTVDKLLSGR